MKWLIWSNEHRSWWREAHNGYTTDRKQAGRYFYEEALQIVAGANQFVSGNTPNETMCPVYGE